MKNKKSYLSLLFGTSFLLLSSCSTPHVHTFSDQWEYDETNHWHAATCEHSEEVSDNGPHQFGDWITITEPSCEEAGREKKVCEVCGYVEYQTIVENGHDYGDWKYRDADNHFRTCSTCKHNDVQPHHWDEGVVSSKLTCTTDGITLFTCLDCGGTKTEKEEHSGHSYKLNDEGTAYICENCGDIMPSGKGDIEFGDENSEEIYKGTYAPMNYLFIGSSITNGYDPTKPNPNADSSHYSMADMFREDFLTVDYKIYNNGFVTKTDVVMRKIEEVTPNKDGTAGVYRCDSETIRLNGDGTGLFNGTAIEYILSGGYILLKEPTGYIYEFAAKLNKGDTVYKYAKDGYTLSDKQEKYIADGTRVASNTSYVFLMRLALQNLSNEKIDKVVIQLSTNDAGQYNTSAGASSGHIPFGTIEDDKFSSSDFDVNTSFGGMEWIIAKAREVWGADVTVYTCHMSSYEYSVCKSNDYDSTKVITTYSEMYDATLKIAEKWNIGLINMWADKDINVAIHEDASRCLADSLHLKEMGYEKVVYPTFRRFFLKGEDLCAN